MIRSMPKTHRADNPLLFDQLFSTNEAAKALGISRQSIARRVKRGYMSPIRQLNRAYLFTAEEVDRARRPLKVKRRRRDDKAAA